MTKQNTELIYAVAQSKRLKTQVKMFGNPHLRSYTQSLGSFTGKEHMTTRNERRRGQA